MLDRAIAKTAEAMAPPMVLVALVIPVAKAVRSGGAPAAALAGSAATRAPEPTPDDRHVDQRLAGGVVEGQPQRVAQGDQQGGHDQRAAGARAGRVVSGRVNAPIARKIT